MKNAGWWGLLCGAALSVACARPTPVYDSGNGTASPDSGGPGTDAFTGADGALPGTDGSAPGTDANTPGTDATTPGTDATTPGTDAAPPGTDAAPPGTDAATPACTAFGPDGFGYIGCASTPPVLPCDDITATGTDALLTDDSWLFVAMGFSFDFYGAASSSVAISSNGNLNFADLYLGLGNVCIPGASSYVPTQFIATFWDDLNPSAAGAVRYQLFGTAPNRRFVVQWNTAVFGGTGTDTLDVRAVLYEGTNDIDVCYVDTSVFDAAYNFGIGATAGLQQSTSAGLGYSCNMPVLTNGLLLHYDHP